MKVYLQELTYDDIKIIKPWLIDKDNAKWLDNFFNNENLKDEQIAFFLLKKNKKIFLVLYDTIPVGVVGLNDIDPINRSAEIWCLIGNKNYRRKGIAKTALYLTVKKAFYELDLHSVNAWVVADNVMKAGLEQLHFKTIGRQRECHMIDGTLKDRILFDILYDDFKNILCPTFND